MGGHRGKALVDTSVKGQAWTTSPALSLPLQGPGGTQMPVERFTDLEPEGLVGRDGLGGRIVGERGERRRRGMQRGQLYQTHAHTRTHKNG